MWQRVKTAVGNLERSLLRPSSPFRLLFTFIAVLMLTAFLYANENRGKVSGRVIDKKTGESELNKYQ